MIKQFKHKGLEDFFYGGKKKGINPKHAPKLGDILDMLDAATDIEDMNFPGSGLHPLQPKKDKIYSVSVSGAWRVTFKIEDGDAYVVDYRQYH
ncbi:MAG: type II toxin-antitoxin system RelE/ParE family toxin [Thermodesulfobacteriota bacterium]|nr:type II toxin-antitoxin system RelE/ParE family toxin [Thermodesulfobacteriota bacterium]